MKLYGWVIIFFIILFPLSFLLYFFLGQSEYKYIVIDKTPVITLKNEVNSDYYKTRLDTINYTAILSYGLIDKNFFVGDIKFDFSREKIIIKPLSKNLYEEIKSLAISIENNYYEKNEILSLFGVQLPFYYFTTTYLDMILKPTICILNLEKFNTEDIEYLKAVYFVFDEELYQPYSFNVRFLEALNDNTGIILSKEILDNPGVQPLLEILKENNVIITEDLKVINFREDI